jgi:hypothetical protein
VARDAGRPVRQWPRVVRPLSILQLERPPPPLPDRPREARCQTNGRTSENSGNLRPPCSNSHPGESRVSEQRSQLMLVENKSHALMTLVSIFVPLLLTSYSCVVVPRRAVNNTRGGGGGSLTGFWLASTSRQVPTCLAAPDACRMLRARLALGESRPAKGHQLLCPNHSALRRQFGRGQVSRQSH